MGVRQRVVTAIHICLPPKKAIPRGDILGYLPQNPSVTPQFPLIVRQVITPGLAGKTGLLRPYAKSDLDFVEHLLTQVGLADLAGPAVLQNAEDANENHQQAERKP